MRRTTPARFFIDYCFMRCSRVRLTDPSQFIKSAWIRPEDLAVYEAMGYTSFKLLERGIPSAELLRRVKAYSERRFDGTWRNCCCRMASSNRSARNRSGICVTS